MLCWRCGTPIKYINTCRDTEETAWISREDKKILKSFVDILHSCLSKLRTRRVAFSVMDDAGTVRTVQIVRLKNSRFYRFEHKRIHRLHGGKPPITGSGQYNFLLCLSSTHRQVPTLTELNGKNKHSLTSATEISLDTV